MAKTDGFFLLAMRCRGSNYSKDVAKILGGNHKRGLNIKDEFPDQVICVNYSALCQEPEVRISEIENFLGLELAQSIIDDLKSMPAKREMVGRHKYQQSSNFDDDLYFVSKLGFDI